jgi:hypothetical protein
MNDNTSLPSRTQQVSSTPALFAGFYVMHGARAVGKTVTAIAMHYWLLAQQFRSVYRYVLEPRSILNLQLLRPGEWDIFLDAQLKVASGGALFLDSMTYVVSKIKEAEAFEAGSKGATYPGGLRPVDVVGALAHDSRARQQGVALIGTLNSELFPVVKDLEGAVEGEIRVMGPGSVLIRDRSTRRENTVDVPSQYLEAAKRSLGYSKLEGVSSSKLDTY